MPTHTPAPNQAATHLVGASPVGVRAALRILKTVKREASRAQPRRPLPITLTLFEWPTDRSEGAADFEQDFPGDWLPSELHAGGGDTAEFGSGVRPAAGWAYSFQTTHPADSLSGVHHLETWSLLAAPDQALLVPWPLAVADLTPPELARRLTWGRWAVKPGEPTWVPGRATTPGGLGPTIPAVPRTRTLIAPRAERVPQVVLIDDYVLCSLLALDLLIAAAEDLLAAERAETPVPAAPALRSPTDDEWRAWFLYVNLKLGQTVAAEKLTAETHKRWNQPAVSRACTVVKAYLGSGGLVPAWVLDPRIKGPSRATPVDPRHLDEGSPTRHRQRKRGSGDEEAVP